MKNVILIIILFIVVVFSAIYSTKWQVFGADNFEKENEILADKKKEVIEEKIIEKKDRLQKLEVVEDSTYGSLMKENGVDYALAMTIYDVAQPIYDLIKIRVGRFIDLTYDKDTDELKELKYKIDTEDELIVRLDEKNNWNATSTPIPYELKTKKVIGKIDSSLYQAALDQDIDIRAIIELANAFQWTLDFSMDPRVGDTFEFVFEERYLDGEYVMPGQVLAGVYVNDGVKFQVYYFEESIDNKGYFDENGNSVQKMFLKAPVAFKYISSGFTTGPRYLAKFKTFTKTHMAIDYAAAIGTPIRAVGDGKVTFAGWNSSGYGYFTKIRHNSTYGTNYAHQSKIVVKVGQRVKQGDVIGYVGSTGFSTGPHLHYEMVKNGIKVNALKEVLPPGEAIKTENMERFKKIVDEFAF